MANFVESTIVIIKNLKNEFLITKIEISAENEGF